MAQILRSVEGSVAVDSDPMEWDLNAVVANVCSPESHLRKSLPLPSFPPQGFLEAVLRENDVNGLALLQDVNDQVLKVDFGIKSMGQRASVKRFILYLKQRSYKWRQEGALLAPDTGAGLVNQDFASSSSDLRTPQSTTRSFGLQWPWASPSAPAAGHSSLAHGFHNGHNHTMSHLNDGSPLVRYDDDHRERSVTVKSEHADSALANQLRTIPLSSFYGHPHLGRQGPVCQALVLEDSRTFEPDTPALSRSPLMEKPVKVKRRIAPTNISTICQSATQDGAQPMLSPPMSADEEPEQDEQTMLSPNHNQPNLSAVGQSPRPAEDSSSVGPGEQVVVDQFPEQPGVVFRDPNQRKRVAPICIDPRSPPIPFNTIPSPKAANAEMAEDLDPVGTSLRPTNEFRSSKSRRRSGKRAEHMYLGSQSMPVDELFYGSTRIDKVLEDEPDHIDDEIVLVQNHSSSSGQSVYVNSCMKHFFRSKPMPVQGHSKDLIAVVPYKEHLIEAHRPASITVITRYKPGVLVSRRRNRADYKLSSHGDSLHPIPKGSSSGIFKVQVPTMAVDMAADHEWQSLEKWNHVHGHDDVLPLYGDSGSENEFDLDLWAEIELEAGQQARPLGRWSKAPLADAVVGTAIDKVIDRIINDWEKTQGSAMERKAWRLWARAKRDGNRVERISDALNKISALTERLQKLRNEILKEDWTNEIRLLRQCKILQPTTIDREFARWEKQVLELRKPPQKPTPRVKESSAKAEKHRVYQLLPAEGEDVLDSERPGSSSDDSLENFIVDDDNESKQTLPVGDDVCMADASDHQSSLLPIPFGQTASASAVVDGQDSRDDTTNKSHSKAVKKPSNSANIVDLTEITEDDEDIGDFKSRCDPSDCADVKVQIAAGDEEQPLKTNAKIAFKKPLIPSQARSNVIVVETTSSDLSDASVKVTHTVNQKPALNDYPAIAKLNSLKLVEQGDRRRLLVWIVVHANRGRRLAIYEVLKNHDMEEVRGYMITALQTWLAHARLIRGLSDGLSGTLMALSVWLISYTIPTVTTMDGLPPDDIEMTIDETRDGHTFRLFYDLLMLTLRPYIENLDHNSCTQGEKDKVQRHSSQKDNDKIMSSQESLPSSQSTNRRKISRDVSGAFNKPRQRVYEVEESQTALEKRQSARERMQQAQDRRRRDLSLQGRGLVDQMTSDKVLVNHATAEVQESIYLKSFRNGLSLKPHQIEGLQFLWREITADHNDLQGCLLAHTMGLGKTIQVIALLVALAQAGCSTNPRVKKQVPPSLRKSRTVILCPPTLVENWNDELLRWIPDSASASIGAIFKITSGLDLSDRLEAIRHWDERDGVLLMSYTLFRDLILSKKHQNGMPALPTEVSIEVRKILLERAGLVIADEAHYFKNENSAISKTVKRFKTKSRVALTGSPLANNLIEYFALIDWVSPEFLGTRTEFKATYEEPIREGLDRNAPGGRYRDALKRLKRLHLEIEPKVLRADNDVLHKSLHGKKEFLVRVPLTDLQRQLYSLFVTEMSDALKVKGDRMRILACLAQLQLLCHHPQLYFNRLKDMELDTTAAEKEAKSKQMIDEGPSVTLDELNIADMSDDVDVKSALESWVAKSKDVLGGTQSLHLCAQSPKLTTALHLLELSLLVSDKILVFSHRPAALKYLQERLRERDSALKTIRIAGDVASHKRQDVTKEFNEGQARVGFVSTKAGGVGLNLYAANRVIILDEGFNPMFEQQAIGRAYRIGQQKSVYVYRLLSGGTFEDALQNQGLFKTQLAARVVDHQSIKRNASKKPGEYIFEPKTCVPESLEGLRGLDPEVLDKVILKSDR